MVNKKKRTGLDALDLNTSASTVKKDVKSNISSETESRAAKNLPKPEKQKDIAKTSVYVPRAVFEQWRELAFTENKKMHDYLVEGLERVFEDRGLKSFNELSE